MSSIPSELHCMVHGQLFICYDTPNKYKLIYLFYKADNRLGSLWFNEIDSSNQSNPQYLQPNITDQSQCIALYLITDVFLGKQSPLFGADANNDCCFSIISKSHTLHLCASNNGVRTQYMDGIRYVFKQSSVQQQNNTNNQSVANTNSNVVTTTNTASSSPSINEMMNGSYFTSYTSTDPSGQQLFLWYDSSEGGTLGSICWNTTNIKNKQANQMLSVRRITDVFLGKQSDILQPIPNPANQCLSIIGRDNNSLYLLAPSEAVRAIWLNGIKDIYNLAGRKVDDNKTNSSTQKRAISTIATDTTVPNTNLSSPSSNIYVPQSSPSSGTALPDMSSPMSSAPQSAPISHTTDTKRYGTAPLQQPNNDSLYPVYEGIDGNNYNNIDPVIQLQQMQDMIPLDSDSPLNILERGDLFTLFTIKQTRVESYRIYLYYDSNDNKLGTLYWTYDIQRNKLPDLSIPCHRITDLFLGKQSTELQSTTAQSIHSNQCFQIVSRDRTLNLAARTHQQRTQWISAIKTVFASKGKRVDEQKVNNKTVNNPQSTVVPVTNTSNNTTSSTNTTGATGSDIDKTIEASIPSAAGTDITTSDANNVSDNTVTATDTIPSIDQQSSTNEHQSDDMSFTDKNTTPGVTGLAGATDMILPSNQSIPTTPEYIDTSINDITSAVPIYESSNIDHVITLNPTSTDQAISDAAVPPSNTTNTVTIMNTDSNDVSNTHSTAEAVRDIAAGAAATVGLAGVAAAIHNNDKSHDNNTTSDATSMDSHRLDSDGFTVLSTVPSIKQSTDTPNILSPSTGAIDPTATPTSNVNEGCVMIAYIRNSLDQSIQRTGVQIWYDSTASKHGTLYAQLQSGEHNINNAIGLPLHMISDVYVGKKTPELQSAAAAIAPSNTCFSLVSRTISYHLQCVSNDDRTLWLNTIRSALMRGGKPIRETKPHSQVQPMSSPPVMSPVQALHSNNNNKATAVAATVTTTIPMWPTDDHSLGTSAQPIAPVSSDHTTTTSTATSKLADTVNKLTNNSSSHITPDSNVSDESVYELPAQYDSSKQYIGTPFGVGYIEQSQSQPVQSTQTTTTFIPVGLYTSDTVIYMHPTELQTYKKLNTPVESSTDTPIHQLSTMNGTTQLYSDLNATFTRVIDDQSTQLKFSYNEEEQTITYSHTNNAQSESISIYGISDIYIDKHIEPTNKSLAKQSHLFTVVTTDQILNLISQTTAQRNNYVTALNSLLLQHNMKLSVVKQPTTDYNRPEQISQYTYTKNNISIDGAINRLSNSVPVIYWFNATQHNAAQLLYQPDQQTLAIITQSSDHVTIPISSITNVSMGKRSTLFQSIQCSNIPHTNCMSIQCNDAVYNIECSDQQQRDTIFHDLKSIISATPVESTEYTPFTRHGTYVTLYQADSQLNRITRHTTHIYYSAGTLYYSPLVPFSSSVQNAVYELSLDMISDVYLGKQTPVLNSAECILLDTDQCITLYAVQSNVRLNLVFDTVQQRDQFFVHYTNLVKSLNKSLISTSTNLNRSSLSISAHLTNGTLFTAHSLTGQQQIILWYDQSTQCLCWRDSHQSGMDTQLIMVEQQSLPVRQISKLHIGKQTDTNIFDTVHGTLTSPLNTFSILGKPQSLYLEANNTQIRDLWCDQLTELIRYNGKRLSFNKHNTANTTQLQHNQLLVMLQRAATLNNAKQPYHNKLFNTSTTAFMTHVNDRTIQQQIDTTRVFHQLILGSTFTIHNVYDMYSKHADTQQYNGMMFYEPDGRLGTLYWCDSINHRVMNQSHCIYVDCITAIHIGTEPNLFHSNANELLCLSIYSTARRLSIESKSQSDLNMWLYGISLLLTGLGLNMSVDEPLGNNEQTVHNKSPLRQHYAVSRSTTMESLDGIMYSSATQSSDELLHNGTLFMMNTESNGLSIKQSVHVFTKYDCDTGVDCDVLYWTYAMDDQPNIDQSLTSDEIEHIELIDSIIHINARHMKFTLSHQDKNTITQWYHALQSWSKPQ